MGKNAGQNQSCLNVFVGIVHRQGTGKVDEPCFRGGIHNVVPPGTNTKSGGDIDNLSTSLSHHVREYCTTAVKSPGQIHVDAHAPLFVGNCFDGPIHTTCGPT